MLLNYKFKKIGQRPQPKAPAKGWSASGRGQLLAEIVLWTKKYG